PWHLHVTWGDGSAAYDHDYALRGSLGMAPHAYDDNGVYTVTETITDKDGGSDTQTYKVTVDNVAPTASLGNNGPVDEGSPAPADDTGNEGTSKSFAPGSFSDARPDCPWAVDVAWGDGSAQYATAKASSGALGSASHTYADNGVYTVTVKVTDKDGGFGTAT